MRNDKKTQNKVIMDYIQRRISIIDKHLDNCYKFLQETESNLIFTDDPRVKIKSQIDISYIKNKITELEKVQSILLEGDVNKIKQIDSDIFSDSKIKYKEIVIDLKNDISFPKKDIFIGRETEMIELLEKLINGDNVEITGMLGMGGVGKTAIANEICHIIRETWNEGPKIQSYLRPILKNKKYFEDGILFINLKSDFEDLESITESILKKIFGNQNFETLKSLDDAIRVIKDKKILVVLDSAEQNEKVFNDLFFKFKDIFPMMITSRKRIANINPIEIKQMNEKDAFQLFVKILNRKLVTEDESLIGELCRTIGYLPLAIKILASHANVLNMPINLLIREYEKSKLKLLKTNDPIDIDEKNRSAEVCISLSYDKLLPIQQLIFVKAGLFYHPFNEEDLSAICEIENITNEILTLVRFSLINQINEQKIKYELHPVIREFTIQKLKEQNIYTVEQDKYIKYFLNNTQKAYTDNGYFLEILAILNNCNSEIFNAFVDVIWLFLFNKWKISQNITIFRTALTNSILTNKIDKQAFYRLCIADMLKIKGELDLAKKDYETVLKLLNENPSISNADTYKMMIKVSFCEYYFMKGEYQNCINEIFKELRNNPQNGLIINFLVHIYSNWNLILSNEALIYSFIYSVSHETPDLGFTFNVFISFYSFKFNRVKNELLKKYILQILDFANKLGSHDNIRRFLGFLIVLDIDLNNISEAEKNLQVIKEISENYDLDIKGCYQFINEQHGKINLKKGLFQESLRLFNLIEEEGDKDFYLGKTYIALKNYDNAEKHLNNALIYYESKQLPYEIAEIQTQIALLNFAKDKSDQSINKAINSLEYAINLKNEYGYIDLENEYELKNNILQYFNNSKTVYNSYIVNSYDIKSILPKYLYLNLPPEFKSKKDNKKMMLIPEGLAYLGEGDPIILDFDEIIYNMEDYLNRKLRKISKCQILYLYSYYIDNNPILEVEYATFCKQTKRNYPAYWFADIEYHCNNRQPLMDITEEDLKAYADWAGKFPATDFEIQKAWRGINYSITPNNSNLEIEKIYELFIAKTSCLTTEIFAFLIGDIINRKEFDNIDWFDTSFNADVYLKDINIKKGENTNWQFSEIVYQNEYLILPILKLLSYSTSFNGIDKKLKIINNISKMDFIKLNRLYHILLKDIIIQYFIFKFDKSALNQLITENHLWKLAVRKKLNLLKEFHLNRSYLGYRCVVPCYNFNS